MKRILPAARRQSKRKVQFYTTGKPWRMVGTRRLVALGEVRLFEDKLVSKKGNVQANHLRLALYNFSVIVPVLPENRLVFEWNYRHVLGGWELELPAGLMEVGETPIECARRELEEETGYTGGSWKELGWTHTLPGITGQRAYVFLAKKFKKGVPKREAGEMMRMKTLSIREAYRVLRSGGIVHAPTVVALALAEDELSAGLK